MRDRAALFALIWVLGCRGDRQADPAASTSISATPKDAALDSAVAEKLITDQWGARVGLGAANCILEFANGKPVAADKTPLGMTTSKNDVTLRGPDAERCVKSLEGAHALTVGSCKDASGTRECNGTIQAKSASAYCEERKLFKRVCAGQARCPRTPGEHAASRSATLGRDGELAKAHAAGLAGDAWSAADTTGLEGLVAQLDTESAAKVDSTHGAHAATTTEHAAVAAAKAYIRRLRNALPRVLREAAIAELTAESFHAGKKLGRSTPLISKYLNDIRPAVAKVDAPLQAFSNGGLGIAALDKVKSALDGADATQEIAHANIPAETLKVYETKGRVLKAIEDLNRAGKSAFDGQAELAGKFNKDILLRARTAKRPGAVAAPPPPPPPPPQA